MIMMAETVVGKTNLFSYHHHRYQQQQVCVSPRSCSLRMSLSSSLKVKPLVMRSSASSLRSDFHGRKLVIEKPRRWNCSPRASSINAQMNLRIGKQQKWWEKGLQPNMKEVESAQDLVDSLLNAGDQLVIVDFFSPGCGGCKALHPKICQLAEQNPEVQFLHVNYEEHKSMCKSLNVHVLPFFRFYRGASGRLCSFSCTNATIKKFKDALAKHTPARCSLGPAKGLEERDLLALAANKDLSFTYTPKPALQPQPLAVPETAPSFSNADLPLPRPIEEKKTLVASGR